MSKSEMSTFRKVLEEKRKDLLSTCSHRDDIVIEATADDIDRLQQQVTREVAIHHLDKSAKLLKSVQAALDRVEDEIYGVCLRCEEPIAEKRLKAIPWASYCVNCQEAVDLEGVFDGDDGNTIGFAA
ncbi:MAG: TraR/DksA family transcriptional regulator [Acidobacteriaceae bacterium]|nr:TraR/DksA family transcriptional regulator [Acidobacteriaceae bacterium]